MLKNIDEAKQLAWRIRSDVLDMTFHAGVEGGHLGGAYSCAEILATLYGLVMNTNPVHPDDENRDHFLLSKGHVSLAHYAVLKECGFLTQEDLDSFEKNGSLYSTHELVDSEHGIEVTSGSLGYGLSIGIGECLAAKQKGLVYQTYVLLGDGECNEGSVWEAVMAAARFRLDNLTAIIDRNNQQLDGFTERIMPVHDFGRVFEGFDWTVVETDGHDIERLVSALHTKREGKPLAVIADTVKGKGLTPIEGKEGWHHARIDEMMYREFKKLLEEARC